MKKSEWVHSSVDFSSEVTFWTFSKTYFLKTSVMILYISVTFVVFTVILFLVKPGKIKSIFSQNAIHLSNIMNAF